MIRNLAFMVCAMLVSSVGAWGEGIARLGQSAPQFTLPDSSGKPVSLSDFSGKVVVLEWVNPDCPFVQRHYNAGTMKTLAERYNGKVVWLAINTTGSATPQQNAQWISKYSLSYPILSDTDGKIGRAYGAKTTPHMFIVDQKGALVYQGGIDNDPSGRNNDRVNYVAKALGEVLAGQSVSEPETRAYGCSVKYR